MVSKKINPFEKNGTGKNCRYPTSSHQKGPPRCRQKNLLPSGCGRKTDTSWDEGTFTLRKTNMAMENEPFESMYSLLKMEGFSHVMLVFRGVCYIVSIWVDVSPIYKTWVIFQLAMFVFGGVLRGMLVQFLGAFFPLLFHGHAFNSFILALIGLPQKQNSSRILIIMLSLKPHYPKSPSTRVKWDGTVTLYCFI